MIAKVAIDTAKVWWQGSALRIIKCWVNNDGSKYIVYMWIEMFHWILKFQWKEKKDHIVWLYLGAYDLFKCENYDLWTSVLLRLCIVPQNIFGHVLKLKN